MTKTGRIVSWGALRRRVAAVVLCAQRLPKLAWLGMVIVVAAGGLVAVRLNSQPTAERSFITQFPVTASASGSHSSTDSGSAPSSISPTTSAPAQSSPTAPNAATNTTNGAKKSSSSGSSSSSGGSSSGSSGSGSGSGAGGSGGTPGGSGATTTYVKPGTQGYRGALSALTVYSAANGQVPPGTQCSWNQTYKYMRCDDTNLSLDHVYVQGGLYWTGCGTLTMTNSIFDWAPSQTWFDVDNACQSPNAGSVITASYSTFETNPSVVHYTGGSDIGGIYEYTGDVPMKVSHSLIQGFSQGFDPGGGSVISDDEIYIQDNVCNGNVICHGDGLFSQGGDGIVYEDNYIVSPGDATSAIFYQSSPNSSGNSVIGNYLQGGSYALYNENSNGVVVENNTFGGSTYGDCSLRSGASWGAWSGNVTTSGVAVVPEGNGGCS